MRREWLEKDYYGALGVSKDASAKEIRKAYRKLAQQYHPDANPGDKAAEDKFKEINEANAVLGDTDTRRQYDETREMGPFVGGPGGTTHVRIEDLSDMFNGDADGFGVFGGLADLFGGGGRRRSAPQPGRDLTTDVNLSFHEGLSGATKSVLVNQKSTRVKIPAGIADMAKIKVAGKGGAGAPGAKRGDLYVRVHVAEHPVFKRDGKNLRIAVPVTYTEASLGAEITVPTIGSSVTLRMPAGTPNGKTFRVRGEGNANPKGDKGDLLVTVEIEVPDHLGAEQKRLLTELREQEKGRNPRSHLGV